MKKWWKTIIDIVYPPKCPSCKNSVDEHGAWCAECGRKIVAARFINILEHKLLFLDSCWVACEYTGILKRIIHDMKFRRQRGHAIYLQWLVQKHINPEIFAMVDYVIPVPLHEKRLQKRGYNQTAVIFKDVFKEKFDESLNLWMPELMRRTRDTIPQWELKLADRKKNIQAAFTLINPEIIKNKQILLVDDIITTGITLDECAKVLKQAGALNVHALVVASGAR